MAHEPFEPSIAGSQAFPPYEFTDVNLRVFLLPADGGILQGVCDRFLNLAPQHTGRFTPLRDDDGVFKVTMEVAVYDSCFVPKPPWNRFGKIPQQELLFYVPVRLTKPNHSTEIGMFITHIFVDDQSSAFTGREVVGLPKMLAKFHIHPKYPNAGTIEMSFKGRHRENDQLIFHPVVQVGRPGRAKKSTSGDPRVMRFLGPLESYSNSEDFPQIEKAFLTGELIGFSSRILIDPEDQNRDSYQSIMRFVYQDRSTLLPQTRPVQVTLIPLGALDIARRLGITNTNGVVDAAVTNTTTDFCLQNVTTLWETCRPTPRTHDTNVAP